MIALLSCVAEEDLKVIGANNNSDDDDQPNTELVTVDASAITPVKNQTNSEENNRRKRNRPMPKASILKRKKICNNKLELQVIAAEASSTINMQDLV